MDDLLLEIQEQSHFTAIVARKGSESEDKFEVRTVLFEIPNILFRAFIYHLNYATLYINNAQRGAHY